MSLFNSTLHIPQAVQNIAIAYDPYKHGFVWDQLLPRYMSDHRTDNIRSIDKGQTLRLYDLRTGKGSRIQDVNYKPSDNFLFRCTDYAVEAIISGTERGEADVALKHEVRQTMQAITAMQIQQEYLTFSTLRDNTILTSGATLTAADQWDNDLSPDSFPLQDLQDACLQVMVNTGSKANRIVMHSFVLAALRRHRKTLSVFGIAPNVGAMASKAQLEEWIGCEPGAIIETAAHYNASIEGVADDFRAFIGPDVIVARVEEPNLDNYGLGVSVCFQGDNSMWGGDVPEVQGPMLVLSYFDPKADPRGAWVNRVVAAIDQKIMVPKAGYLLKAVVDGSNTAKYGTFLLS